MLNSHTIYLTFKIEHLAFTHVKIKNTLRIYS